MINIQIGSALLFISGKFKYHHIEKYRFYSEIMICSCETFSKYNTSTRSNIFMMGVTKCGITIVRDIPYIFTNS